MFPNLSCAYRHTDHEASLSNRLSQNCAIFLAIPNLFYNFSVSLENG